MKFSIKMIMGTTIIIAILFSLGGIYMVNKNFDVAYDNTIESYSKEHILRRYSLEAGVRNAIEGGKVYSEDLVNKCAVKMQNYGNDFEGMMIYNESQSIYTNESKSITTKMKKYIDKKNTYRLYKTNQKVYMVISSRVAVGDNDFTLLNMYEITNVFSEKHRQLVMLMQLDIIIIILSIVFVYIFSLILTRNIRKMIKSSKRIADGNYSERTVIKSTDEIGELSTNFDLMAEAVEHHIDKLNIDIQNREEFVSDFSHELKTPMTAIMGYSKMLLGDDCDKETQKKSADYIYRECKRLELLSQKLLLMLGIGEGNIEMSNIYCEWIGEQINNSVKPYLHNIIFNLNLENGIIYGDASLIIDLFKNLIENSVRACECKSIDNYKGIISFTGKIAEDKYIFTVQDNGIGICDEDIDKVTNAFYMVDKSRSRKAGGSGLGLAICDKICQIHNTYLNISSELGKGTTIKVEVDKVEENIEL